MDMGAKSFKNTLASSRKEMKPSLAKADLGAKKDLRAKPIEVRKPKQVQEKQSLNPKEQSKVETNTSGENSSKDELTKEVEATKELATKEEILDKEKVVSEEVLKQIAMMISDFTNRPLEDVMASLEAKIAEMDGALAGEADLKALFLSELLGDKNPVFSNDDEVKLIKDILNTLENLLENMGDDEDKTDLNFEEMMVAMENQGEKASQNEQSSLSEETKQEVSVEVTEEPSKIEVVDLRKEQKSSDNNLKGDTQFTEVLVKEDLAKTDANFEIKPVEKINTAEIIDQIVTKVKVVLEDGKSQVEMKLNPEHLGKVGIKLVSENGTLKGTFTVENETVKHAVEQNLINLKAQLEESGIKIEKIEVALASTGEEKQFNDKENTERQFNNKKSNKNKNTYGTIEEIDSLDEIVVDERMEESIVSYSA